MIAYISNSLVHISLFISLFFEVFLLITYLEGKKEIETSQSTDRKDSEWPTVTVMVPCFNEEKTVLKTIFSILKLDYPKNKLHVLIINDGSTDETLKALSRFQNHPQVTIHTKENGGKFSALNFGLTHVTSDIVGCLDADSFVDPYALKRIATHFDDKEIMAVTPAVLVHEPKNILQFIQKVEYAWGVFLRKLQCRLGAITVTPGPFSMFRTQVFRELGGYRHAHHTEDFEIALRMQSNHYKITNEHNAFVYTVTPSTIHTLVKQRVRWTYGFLNNMIDYKYILFKKEFGNMGMYILPMAILSIFSALYFAATLIINVTTKVFTQIEKFQTIGFDWKFSNLYHFDWFFLNTTATAFLVLTVGALSLSIIYFSRVMTEGRFRFSFDIVYFLLLYGLIVPLWLSKAVFNTVFSKNITWR